MNLQPILGTRAMPAATLPKHRALCDRCGIEFWFDSNRYIAGVPCTDCRDVLTDLGEAWDWHAPAKGAAA